MVFDFEAGYMRTKIRENTCEHHLHSYNDRHYKPNAGTAQCTTRLQPTVNQPRQQHNAPHYSNQPRTQHNTPYNYNQPRTSRDSSTMHHTTTTSRERSIMHHTTTTSREPAANAAQCTTQLQPAVKQLRLYNNAPLKCKVFVRGNLYGKMWSSRTRVL
jgi:hypothetical protein